MVGLAHPPLPTNQPRGDSVFAKRYRDRYWKKEAFESLEGIAAACETHGVTTSEAAIRWMYRHSKLEDRYGDGVIIGASSLPQLEANLESIRRSGEPLHADIVEAFEEGWRKFRPVCQPYHR
jgi:aflatoxin B1 aldehyde reductase